MSAAPLARFKRFPSRSGHVRVPMATRDDALAGIALYAACRPWALRAQRVAWLGVRIFGARVLPGPAVPWTPAEDEAWEALRARWHGELGAFDQVAGFERQQQTRAGNAVLLLRRGKAVAFVKLREGAAPELATEERALQAVARFAPHSFRAPSSLASGQESGVHYLAIEPLAAGLHHPPANPPIRAICEEVSAALSWLPRSVETVPHWRPMHGDLAPWNLRTSGGSCVLIDWEDVGWGPPGADELYYRAVAAALSGTTVDWRGDVETLDYLLGYTASQQWGGGSRDDAMVARMQRVLRAASRPQPAREPAGRRPLAPSDAS